MKAPVGREVRTALRATEVFFVCLVVGLAAYLLLGHRLLTAAYYGKAVPFVNLLTRDRAPTLGQYLSKADERIMLYAVTAFVSFFFYLLLVLVVRHLLRSDADSVYANPARSSGVRVSEVAGAFVIYSLLTVAFFYSVIPHITSQLIGPPEDNMQHLWDVWWARHALLGRLDFLRTTYVFYPEGSSLLYHAYSPYNLLVALSVGRPLSPVTVYNLLILSTFVLSGIGAFLLIRHLTGDTAAALLGGFVFAFNPSHFAHSLHHIEIASIQFIPFFVLYYLKTLEDGSKRNIAWAGLFFLLNSLCSWYYMVYALFCMAACYCFAAYRRKRFLLSGPLVSSLMIVGATLLVLSPLVVRMLSYASQHPGVSIGGYDRFSTDLLGLFVPHYRHWFADVPLIARINGSYAVPHFPWETIGYLGILCVGLTLASSRVLLERAGRYVLGLLLFLGLSFGASLHLMGKTIPVVMPYALIRYVPILSGARAPGRTMAYAYLFLGVVIAIAFSYQLREGFLRKRKWVAALLALGICADFWTPCREMTPVRLPPAYKVILAQEPRVDFAILDLPGEGDVRSARYMMYQTLHQIPIVQGYLGREPTASLLSRLEYHDLAAQRVQLRSAHVKYIVIHKQLLVPETGNGREFDLDRYAEEYGEFFEDGENLVLRVY